MAQRAAMADADQACETWKRSTDEYARLPPSDEYVLALVAESQCRLSQRHYVLAWKTLETAADVARRNNLHPVDLDFAKAQGSDESLGSGRQDMTEAKWSAHPSRA